MFDAVFGVLMTTVVFGLLFAAATSPAWIAGVVIAGRNRTLPVPGPMRNKLVRWAIWFIGGLIAAWGLLLGISPNGGVPLGWFIGFALAGLCAYAVSLVAAFYIGWTGRVKRLARRRDAARSVEQWGPRGAARGGPRVIHGNEAEPPVE